MKRKRTQRNIYSSTEARSKLPYLVNKVCEDSKPVYITNRGTTQAVLISYEIYQKALLSDMYSPQDWEMFGAWSDRTDMENSAKWVEKLRDKENNRSGLYKKR